MVQLINQYRELNNPTAIALVKRTVGGEDVQGLVEVKAEGLGVVLGQTQTLLSACLYIGGGGCGGPAIEGLDEDVRSVLVVRDEVSGGIRYLLQPFES